jgi:hypothetical protein
VRVALSALLLVLGVALLVETVWLGGGAVGYVFGVLFVLAGAGRLWLQLRQ